MTPYVPGAGDRLLRFLIALLQPAHSPHRTARERCPSARRRRTPPPRPAGVDHHPLGAVLAPALHLVHVDVVDELPQDLVGQRTHLHELANGTDALVAERVRQEKKQ